MSGDELRQVFSIVDRIYLPHPVARYIARLVAATHARAAEAPPVVRNYVAHGASPRAAIAIAEAARAFALLARRPTVGFEDIKTVAAPVLNHRLILNYKARLDQVDTFAVIRDLLAAIEETGLRLPADMKIREVQHG
jgi:MoxR-like ATPase